MKKRILNFLIILSLIFTFSIISFNTNNEINAITETIYNNKNGLTSTETNDVCQTNDGYIWLGQYEGLYRFDGSTFKKFKEITFSRAIYSNNVTDKTFNDEGVLRQITNIEAGLANSLLIGSQTEGFIIYENGKYLKVVTTMGDNVTDVICDGSTVYVSTTDGIFTVNDHEIIEIEETRGHNISSIHVMNGEIYFIENNVCYKYDGSNIVKINDKYAHKVIYTYNNEIYLGSINGNVIVLDKDYNEKGDYLLSSNHAVTAICGSSTDIIIGTDIGLYRLINGNVTKIEGVSNYYGIKNIIVDYENSFWVASTNGVSKIQNNLLEKIFTKFNIMDTQVNATYLYENILYIGTEIGLICIDQNNQRRIYNDLTIALDNVRIRDIVEYHGKLYIATYDTNVYDLVVYDGTSVTNINSEEFIAGCSEDQYKGLRQIRGFAINEARDILLIGTNYGITIYDGSTYKTTLKQTNDMETKQGLGSRPLYIFSGKDYILSCSDGSGIEVFDYDLNYIDTIPQTDGQVILRCTTYNNQLLYSKGEELYTYDGTSTTKLNVPCTGTVTSLLKNDENLVISTTSEIFYYTYKDDIHTIDFENDYTLIGASHGLTNGVTANGFSYYDENTQIYYFSCKDSVYVLDYNHYENVVTDVKLAVNEVRADNNLVDSDNIVLDKSCSRLVVELSVLSFKDYESYKIYYKLEGYDDDYNYFDYGTSKNIIYTKLNGGDFKLNIYAISNDGVESNHIVLNIQKQLKASEHIWFFPLVISGTFLILLAIVFGIFYLIYSSIKKKNLQLKKITVNAIETISHTVDAKDTYTNGHSIRVAKYSCLIAEELGVSKDKLEELYYIGLLHDIGKIGIPDEILKKPGRLTDSEYSIMKKHPSIGQHILERMNRIDHLSDGVMFHHEKYDGTGYPYGLKGDKIPLYGRIICCADSYDAMSSRRVYRDKRDQEYILEEFKKFSGTQFDPKIVEIVIKLVQEDRFTVDETPLYDD